MTSRQHGEQTAAYSFKDILFDKIAVKKKQFNKQNKMLLENSLCFHTRRVKVHAEIFQFILFANSKMRAPTLTTCTAQFCRSHAFVLLVGT